jgi:NAD(P)-dependent dehydrogenase (short-subunit alcohol dehydrogenase family)
VYAATRGSATHPDPRVVPLTLDVIDDSQIHAAAAQVDTLDILINNADIVLYDDLTDRARLERTLAVNLLGTYTVTQAFLPLLDNGEDDVFPDRMSASLAASWRSRAANALERQNAALTQAVLARAAPVPTVAADPLDPEQPSRF